MNKAGKLHQPFLFILNFELTEGYFIENPLEQKEILFKVNHWSNKPLQSNTSQNNVLTAFPIDPKEYKTKFDIVQQGLQRGNSFVVNLTIKTPVRTPLTLEDIFYRSNTDFQLYIPEKFVCFSPERFIKIEDSSIMTFPMKGTIDASIPHAKEKILSDFKELSEHATVVDLLRNDLSINAHHVSVEKFRYIDRIKTNKKDILQVSSEIRGILPPDFHTKLGDIIFSMLPAGSVSGAPKQSTTRIIREAEQEDRGYYSGVFGYYDGKNLDSAVMIRFIEKQSEELYFRSGGGITTHSKCEEEYQEVINKIYLPA